MRADAGLREAQRALAVGIDGAAEGRGVTGRGGALGVWRGELRGGGEVLDGGVQGRGGVVGEGFVGEHFVAGGGRVHCGVAFVVCGGLVGVRGVGWEDAVGEERLRSVPDMLARSGVERDCGRGWCLRWEAAVVWIVYGIMMQLHTVSSGRVVG